MWRPDPVALPIPVIHKHSSSVEWKILGDGTLRIRKTKHNTARILKITKIEVLRGSFQIRAVEMKKS